MRTSGRVSALVELVLIVVGVLVALGLDGWNTRRLDRQAEAYYREGLLVDVVATQRSLSGITERLEAARQAAEEVYPYLAYGRSTGSSPERLTARLFHSTRTGTPTAVLFIGGTYETLRSTGDLGLISDPELRQALVDFYANRDALEYFFGVQPTSEYANAIRGIIPWYLQDEIRRSCPILEFETNCRVDFADFDVQGFLMSVRSDPQVARVLNRLIERLDITILTLRDASEDADALVLRLEAFSS